MIYRLTIRDKNKKLVYRNTDTVLNLFNDLITKYVLDINVVDAYMIEHYGTKTEKAIFETLNKRKMFSDTEFEINYILCAQLNKWQDNLSEQSMEYIIYKCLSDEYTQEWLEVDNYNEAKTLLKAYNDYTMETFEQNGVVENRTMDIVNYTVENMDDGTQYDLQMSFKVDEQTLYYYVDGDILHSEEMSDIAMVKLLEQGYDEILNDLVATAKQLYFDDLGIEVE